jgi:FKBP-type peptidyl-prolyl cis-trans isomerase SlyD
MTETAPPCAYKVAESSCYAKIRYKVRVAGGPILKGAGELEIMDFVTGYAQVVPGLEKRLVGHCAGEKLSFTVPAEEAFGVKYKELVFEKKKEDFHFPPGFQPQPGMEIPLITSHSEAPDTARIKEVREDAIVIDLNHALAGVALEYDLEILEARPATSKDVCAEWEQQSTDCSCSQQPTTILLGQEDPEAN